MKTFAALSVYPSGLFKNLLESEVLSRHGSVACLSYPLITTFDKNLFSVTSIMYATQAEVNPLGDVYLFKRI